MSKQRLRYDPNNDYYAVLGVKPNAALEEINRAYRNLAKEVHPDRNPDRQDWAHEQFQRINDAKDVLTDPALRRDYNEKRVLYFQSDKSSTYYQHAKRSRNTTYAEASRAAWSKRNRPAYAGPRNLFFVSLIVLAISGVFRVMQEPGNQIRGARQTTIPTQVCDPNAQIQFPINGTRFDDTAMSVVGTAAGSDFQSYMVSLGYRIPGTSNEVWLPLEQALQPVQNGELVNHSTLESIQDNLRGQFRLRLIVRQTDGSILPTCDVSIFVS